MADIKEEERVFEKTLEQDLAWTPDLWFYEYFQGKVGFGLRIKTELHSEQSRFQHIAVYDTYKHGKLLTLDGVVMLTEIDEYIYHEMIVHVPMQTLPEARRVAVIGGGDGGTVRELAKYPELEKITLVEIDERVVEVCKEHMPGVAAKFDDPRVECRYEDGAKFIKELEPQSLDLIIVDSTDPIGPGKVLFTSEFYADASRALADHGVLTAQTETPLYHRSVIEEIYSNLGRVFKNPFMYWMAIPSYIGSIYTLSFASNSKHPIDDHKPRRLPELGCRYYNPDLHKAAFSLPGLIRDALPKGHPQKTS